MKLKKVFQMLKDQSLLQRREQSYVCGCDGSSQRGTLSLLMSLKHLRQKQYLSENKAGVGFLRELKNVKIFFLLLEKSLIELTCFRRQNIWHRVEWCK
jgi:hypothetical protein